MLANTRGENSLYKYYSASTALSVLRAGKFRWGSPASFNDPFDHSFAMHMTGDKDRAMHRLVEGAADIIFSSQPPVIKQPNDFTALLMLVRSGPSGKLTRETWTRDVWPALQAGQANALSYLAEQNEMWKRQSETARIFCLSEVQDSMPMWAHYGANHGGVVMEIRGLATLDSSFLVARPVEYSQTMPALGDYDEMIEGYLGNRSWMESENLFHKLAFVKAEQWRYEQEWRVVTYAAQAEAYNDYKFSPLELPCLYMGVKCTKSDQNGLIAQVKAAYPFTKIFQMEVHPTQFSLVPKLVYEP
ncbi:DUF2971 domain-containing protein [Caballeronia sp. dw_276]|uniref:DUF2971 domain-containing protein n=1 Tax=Caballeronia sp. dw_276 TaxID=2719795 RepID=UPI001BD37F05|nr:DUF2971 domain-containing protein [Caballeronia sp. dw_276]